MNYTIYGLYPLSVERPSLKDFGYIGITEGKLESRRRGHLNEAKGPGTILTSNPKKREWIQSNNYDIGIAYLDSADTEHEARQLEKKYIRYVLNSGGVLTNILI